MCPSVLDIGVQWFKQETWSWSSWSLQSGESDTEQIHTEFPPFSLLCCPSPLPHLSTSHHPLTAIQKIIGLCFIRVCFILMLRCASWFIPATITKYPKLGWHINNKHLVLTFIEAGKSPLIALIDSVSGEDHFLINCTLLAVTFAWWKGQASFLGTLLLGH